MKNIPHFLRFNGMFTDFSTSFYAIMGDTFVLMLLCNLVFQIVFEVFILILAKVRKYVDTKGTFYEDKDDSSLNGKYNTKCSSVKDYMSLDGAFKFEKHWRYS